MPWFTNLEVIICPKAYQHVVPKNIRLGIFAIDMTLYTASP